jgi:hypothetical protein
LKFGAIGQAFSPRIYLSFLTQGDALGWYNGAPLVLGSQFRVGVYLGDWRLGNASNCGLHLAIGGVALTHPALGRRMA